MDITTYYWDHLCVAEKNNFNTSDLLIVFFCSPKAEDFLITFKNDFFQKSYLPWKLEVYCSFEVHRFARSVLQTTNCQRSYLQSYYVWLWTLRSLTLWLQVKSKLLKRAVLWKNVSCGVSIRYLGAALSFISLCFHLMVFLFFLWSSSGVKDVYAYH